MTTKALTVIRPASKPSGESTAVKDHATLDSFTTLAGKTLDDLVLPLAASPVFQMVGSVALIEYLQHIYIGTGSFSWKSQPGTHALVWSEDKYQLISNFLGSAMETVIITTEGLQAIMGSGGGGGGLISLILALLTKGKAAA